MKLYNDIYCAAIVLILLTAFSSFDVSAQSSRKKTSGSAGVVSGNVLHYNTPPAPPMRLLFDYYHHALPSTKVGNYILTGSWSDDNGRYGWDDFVHTNTFDPVFVALESEYTLSMMRQPYTKKLLSETDAVLIINPDNPDIVPGGKAISDEEIALLQQFVRDGGSLMLMVNAGGDRKAYEGFEGVQLRRLVQSFGLDWNDDDTHYSDNLMPEAHPHFYDVPLFHYGAGCTLQILEGAEELEILLNVYSDAGYPDRDVKGPGIVMTRPGRGKFILIGDVGSWTGNISRPWADNVSILRQLFRYLKPSNGVVPPQFRQGQSLNYEVTVAELQAIPVANSLSLFEKEHYRFFSPRPATKMPYLEATAQVTVSCTEQLRDSGAVMEAGVDGFKWFDEDTPNKGRNTITFRASRQGKVSGIEAEGSHAQWLAPDISALVALLPVDGLRPGDRWESREGLRIPMLRGTDIPPVVPFDTEIVYVADGEADGHAVRHLRSSGELWLDEIGVTVEDILPDELTYRVGGSHYSFYKPHGGKLLFKREQWVDSKTGIVHKARVQYRVVAWIRDDRKPDFASNADKDNSMIVSLSHVVNFNLK
jgi:hypothetical protein